ncbi:unnamed protein product [Leptosia nina]|uniref:Uncharacterized protein n=1 Tax=Leptosia nina TaxID=320188 RepID=A0AAV1JK38_9NEOP
MAAKLTIVVLTVFLVQMISAQCIRRASGPLLGSPITAPFGAVPWGQPSAPCSRFGMGINNFAASHGGILEVFSSSPIPATGVSVYSENEIQGRLAVSGELPFLATVAVEGPLPTFGSGAVAFNSGNGVAAITRENAC